MAEERWSLTVRRPKPNEYFSASEFVEGVPLVAPRWIAEAYDHLNGDRTIHVGWSEARATRKAQRFIAKLEKAEASEYDVAPSPKSRTGGRR